MAKKPVSAAASPAASKSAAKPKSAKPASVTPVRNSAIPPKSAAKAEVTHEMIARRAFELSASDQDRGEFENWCRAERELRDQSSQ